MNNVKNLSLFGVCFAFIVIALGAWTRLVDAGLGCPDWPGCYGFVVFPTDEAEIALAESRFPSFPYDINKAIPEVVHRYFAATLGFVAILLTYISFKYKEGKSLHWWSLGLLIFICCQGLFGYLTVSLKLLPIIVTGHLFGGFFTLSLFYFIFLKSGNFKILDQMKVPQLKTISLLAMIILLFQIFLGAWTSTNYASLACVDFPTCQGTYFPEMDFKQGFNFSQEVGPNYLYGLLDNSARVAIHYSHRISAILVTIVFLILISKLWFSAAAPLASTLGILLLTQISLGIINVIYVLPLYVAIAHNLIAATLLLGTITVNYLAWKK
ncbi:MAG: COX15/CtaA family protein [SAR86 cluster bacterium]|nr:COX15/CtaA family protein [SAR86 cluster bacterium]MDG1948214.1 COX15/CtaA family protein [SAR86 cluster bacterium]MDG2092121.1 COX15/CtaA family protein [SAR86 cluster bacterium]|tara:strand:- start:2225 stop:3199 length:975 start_codon:yes stop_codon:yes gene_type:complete